jgi:itaconate CoA-transferase
MDLRQTYESKRLTAEQAASRLQSNTDIAMGMAISEPPALLRALALRVQAGELSNLSLWYFHSLAHAGNSVLRPELLGRIRPHCMFLSRIERELAAPAGTSLSDLIEFVPTAFSDSARLLSERVALDAFITTVSPMDRHGWFTFGTNNDYASTAARAARQLIVEVNPNMPRVFGESLLHVSEVDAIVENEAPLIEVADRAAGPEDQAIAAIVAGMVDDGACLQMGIGTLPTAVCALLKDRKHLGIHTELLTPALAELIECGAVTNQRKTTYRGRSVFTFAMGTKRFYEFLHDNPSMHSAPVHIVNDPRHISKNDNVVSVNATLQMDLSGACNSEHLLGRQYSGSGGQLDFVRGACASNGGRSIIACHSTASGGAVSRIVPTLQGPVTTPRNDTHIVATEFGWADLKGKSLSERAEALIALAHPKFRAELSASLTGCRDIGS